MEMVDKFEKSRTRRRRKVCGLAHSKPDGREAHLPQGTRPRPRSKRHLREIAEEALAEVSSDDERRAAFELARKKARSTEGLDYEVRRRRIYGALARRGLSPDQTMSAVRAVLDDNDYSSYYTSN